MGVNIHVSFMGVNIHVSFQIKFKFIKLVAKKSVGQNMNSINIRRPQLNVLVTGCNLYTRWGDLIKF